VAAHFQISGDDAADHPIYGDVPAATDDVKAEISSHGEEYSPAMEVAVRAQDIHDAFLPPNRTLLHDIDHLPAIPCYRECVVFFRDTVSVGC